MCSAVRVRSHRSVPCPWHKARGESQNHIDIHAAPLEQLGFPALPMGELGVRNIITGFYLFIKFLETAVAYDVYLALNDLICKAVRLDSLIFKRT